MSRLIRTTIAMLLCGSMLLASIGCAMAQSGNDDGLYQDLGGQQKIALMTNVFLGRIAEDESILHYFYGVDISLLEGRLVQYIAVVSGGPEIYEGEALGLVHGRYYITDRASNAVVENMQDAMEEVGMPIHARNELIARLAPLQRRIVTYRGEGS